MPLYQGSLTEPGRPSPYRDRSREENLDLFRRMRAGEFEPGARTLRAKIDMASPVLVLRDPVLYRIVKASHHRTGDHWCIYPMYDFAHPLSDAIEGVTHSLCSLGVRRPPAALRLGDRATARCRAGRGRPSSAALEPHLHGDEQALAEAARRGRPRARLGRSAHADALRDPAPRRSAGRDPELQPRRRPHQARHHDRAAAPRARGPRGAEPHRAARDGGAESAARGDRELPGRASGSTSKR